MHKKLYCLAHPLPTERANSIRQSMVWPLTFCDMKVGGLAPGYLAGTKPQKLCTHIKICRVANSFHLSGLHSDQHCRSRPYLAEVGVANTATQVFFLLRTDWPDLGLRSTQIYLHCPFLVSAATVSIDSFVMSVWSMLQPKQSFADT